jgi:hypothetical protein
MCASCLQAHIAFSGNHSDLAELMSEPKNFLWAVRADGTEEHHLEGYGGNIWSPDERWLVYGSWNSSGRTVMGVEVGVWQPQQVPLPPDSTVEDWGVVSP